MVKRLTLTDDLLARILLVQRAARAAREGHIDYSASELERIELADAIVVAFERQAADPGRRLPERVGDLAPVVDVRLTPKRRRA